MNVKSLAKKKALAKTLIPAACAVMAEEYVKPIGKRIKLTHYFIAEKLQITNGVAYAVLAQVAYRRKYCLRLGDGAIYWDNEPLPVGKVMEAVANTKLHRVIPNYECKIARTCILATDQLRPTLQAHGLTVLKDYGVETLVCDNKEVARGDVLMVRGEKGAFRNLLMEVKELWTSNNPQFGSWEKQTYEAKA